MSGSFTQVMYTDNPLVTSAPTGSGKTVIFELAIVHLMMQSSSDITTGKIIYGEYRRGTHVHKFA